MRGRDRPWSRVHDTTTTLQQFGVRAWADEWVSHRRPFFFCGKSHNTNTQPEPDTSKKAKPGNPRNRRLQGNPRKPKEIQGNTTGVLGFLVFLVLPHGALGNRTPTLGLPCTTRLLDGRPGFSWRWRALENSARCGRVVIRKNAAVCMKRIPRMDGSVPGLIQADLS